MIKAGQLRQGNIITYNGQLHEVLEAQHNKPGKGGAFIRAKLRNLSSGSPFLVSPFISSSCSTNKGTFPINPVSK